MRGFRFDVVAIAPIVLLLACESTVSPRLGEQQEPPSASAANAKSIKLSIGEEQQLVVSGVSSGVTWRSDDPGVARVSTNGRAVATGIGSTRIVGNRKTGSETFIVHVRTAIDSIRFRQESVTVAAGNSLRLAFRSFDVTGAQEDSAAGARIHWTSMGPGVATVDSTGLIAASEVGRTVIALDVNGAMDSAVVNVVAIPVVNVTLNVPETFSISAGESLTLTAVATGPSGETLPDRSFSWTSARPSIATVSETGVVTGVAPGWGSITVTSEGVSKSANVIVTPQLLASVEVSLVSSGLHVGDSTQATAVARDANGGLLTGRPVVWTSLSPNIATVSAAGMVKAVAPGSAVIRATADSKTGESTVNVTAVVVAPATVASVSVTLANANALVGLSTQAVAVAKDANGNVLTGRTVGWSSLTPGVASVSSTGMVTALAAGTATVRATVDGMSGDGTLFVTAPETGPSAPQILVGPPAAPRLLTTSVSSTPSNGRTIRVAAGDYLQGVLDDAMPGDRIVLPAGSTFTGNFVLRAKPSGSGIPGEWITVQTDGALPAEGTRMTPSEAAEFSLPKLLSPSILPVISAAPGTERWRFVGVEVSTTPDLTVNQGLIVLGDGSANTLPRNLILDRMYIHGTPSLDLRRCVALNGDSEAVIDSYVSDCHAYGFDAQAVWGWNGNGPFKITNNYLEASTEVVGFGGADPSIPNLVPSDIEIRGNHITKPMSWKGGPWLIKNLVELKVGRRVLISGNVIENSWVHAQLGWAFVLYSVNQSGTCTWCVVSDVLIENNLIRNVSSGFQLTEKYGDAQPLQRIAIRNNVLLGVDNPLVSGGGVGFLIQGNINSLSIEHNTAFVATTSSIQWAKTGLLANHVVQNNLIGGGAYPLFVSPSGGWPTVAGNGSAFVGNVVAMGEYFGLTFPAGNMYPASLDAVGLMGGAGAAVSANASPSALGLSPSSAYKGKASDGSDPGANMSALMAATANAIVR